MANIRELFKKGHNLHNSGELSAAAALYLKILDIQPNHADTVFLMGTLYIQQGNIDLAVSFLKKATDLNPKHIVAYKNLGAAFRTQGKLDEAIACYKQATVINPEDAGAHNDLGATLQMLSKFDEAIESHKKAIMHRPIFAGAYSNLGTALKAQGKLDDAIASYKRAIELENDYAEAYNNLGTVLQAQCKLEDAEASYRKAIELKQGYADPHYNLGNVLSEKGKLNEAVTFYKQALTIKQDYVEAYNNLGKALKEQGNLIEALVSYNKAIEIEPDNSIAYVNSGTVFQEQGELEKAVTSYSRAIELDPNNAEGHNNLGSVILHQGKLEEAAAHCAHSIELKPDYSDAYNNQGVILQSQGKVVEAIDSFNKAIIHKDAFAKAQTYMNRSIVLLLAGNFEQGWKEYEWRLRTKDYTSRAFSQPRWDGTPLNGKSILVHAEQGCGDTIHFIRYLPLIRERGGHVIFECQKDLYRILQNCRGVDEIIERTSNSGTFDQPDVHVPLLSLPGIFGTTLATIPSDVPYITVGPDLLNQWRIRLGDDDNYRVGILWAGNRDHKNDRNRSCSLADFAPLADVSGVTFYSLQKELASVETLGPPEGMKLIDMKDELNDFADTAAVICNLDLVISVDTSVVHLAGAIDKPVWNLLPFAPDFRWLLKRDDSPWYPSMRLFRQTQPNDWYGVFKRVKKALINNISKVRIANRKFVKA